MLLMIFTIIAALICVVDAAAALMLPPLMP